MKSFLIFCSIVASIALVAGNNYCDLPCEDYQTNGYIQNIGCNHNNQFDKYNCPRNAKMVPITDSLKQLLVDAHNEKRNFIAGGGDYNHDPACRMATMQWDEHLAHLAGLNVKQCKMDHDRCHKTSDFEYSGQNLAMAGRRPVGVFDAAEKLRGAVQGWFDEVENSTQSVIDSYPMRTKEQIGHFTVMMADRNNRVGCAASTYDKNGVTYFLTACNYATTNMIDFPIYKKCNKPTKDCTSGKNRKYTNLCSEKEVYAVNKWF